jgi:hypothetical protein
LTPQLEIVHVHDWAPALGAGFFACARTAFRHGVDDPPRC